MENIFRSFLTGRGNSNEKVAQLESNVEEMKQMLSDYRFGFGMYDGEKNVGQAPPAVDIETDYYNMALRSWVLFNSSDFAQSVFPKVALHIVGTGFKFMFKPVTRGTSDTAIDIEDVDLIENRFSYFKSDKHNIYGKEDTYNTLLYKALLRVFVAGDTLIVLYIRNGNMMVRNIQGDLVNGTAEGYDVPENNSLSNGVERDSRGDVIAFHVEMNGKIKRIPSTVNINGITLTQAFLVKSPLTSVRCAENRGYSLMSAIMEKASKNDRYSEAVVSGAEKVSNFPIAIEHDKDSIGANPFPEKTSATAALTGASRAIDSFNATASGVKKVSITEESTAINLPTGAKLRAPDMRFTLQYDEFSRSIHGQMASVLQMPPEVALSSYMSNYTAATAAINDWNSVLSVYVKYFFENIEAEVFRFWLVNEVAHSTIQYPSLMKSIVGSDSISLYDLTRSTGKSKHRKNLDPKKEAEALRILMGEDLKGYPIISPRKAMEQVAEEGEYNAVVERIVDDVKKLKEGIDAITPKPAVPVAPAVPKKEDDKK